MSSLIEWDSGLSTGHSKIDKQHRAFFERANHIIAACEAGEGAEHITKLIGFLEDYVLWHFTSEELLMDEYDYPEIKEHQKEHAGFSLSIARLRQQLNRKGSCKHLITATKDTVVHWFVLHIEGSDKALADHIAAKKDAK